MLRTALHGPGLLAPPSARSAATPGTWRGTRRSASAPQARNARGWPRPAVPGPGRKGLPGTRNRRQQYGLGTGRRPYVRPLLTARHTSVWTDVPPCSPASPCEASPDWPPRPFRRPDEASDRDSGRPFVMGSRGPLVRTSAIPSRRGPAIWLGAAAILSLPRRQRCGRGPRCRMARGHRRRAHPRPANRRPGRAVSARGAPASDVGTPPISIRS